MAVFWEWLTFGVQLGYTHCHGVVVGRAVVLLQLTVVQLLLGSSSCSASSACLDCSWYPCRQVTAYWPCVQAVFPDLTMQHAMMRLLFDDGQTGVAHYHCRPVPIATCMHKLCSDISLQERTLYNRHVPRLHTSYTNAQTPQMHASSPSAPGSAVRSSTCVCHPQLAVEHNVLLLISSSPAEVTLHMRSRQHLQLQQLHVTTQPAAAAAKRCAADLRPGLLPPRTCTQY